MTFNLNRHLALSLIFLSFCSILSALPAEDVVPLDNRDYFPKLHELISASTKSVKVLMYAAVFYPNNPSSPSNKIIDDLISAKKRGVDVTVVLEMGNKESDADINKKNGEVNCDSDSRGVSPAALYVNGLP